MKVERVDSYSKEFEVPSFLIIRMHNLSVELIGSVDMGFGETSILYQLLEIPSNSYVKWCMYFWLG